MGVAISGDGVEPHHFSRLVGRVVGGEAGPTLLALGGIHGNEPAGLLAARRVLGRIQGGPIALRGELVFLAGNLGALERNRRHLGEDLNRLWTAERVQAIRANGRPPASPDDAEQRSLLKAIDEVLDRARGPVHFLDLHTTSADGIPFAIGCAEHLGFARAFPLPIVVGLIGHLGGVLLDFMARRGCVTLGVEAGQHEEPRSVERHEAVLWLALVAAGLVAAREVADLDRHRALLARGGSGLPHVLEVVGRHAIRPEDQFRMEPGFANIHRVKKGDLLARDRRGPIAAAADAYLVMPLYQALGDDGFFVARALEG